MLLLSFLLISYSRRITSKLSNDLEIQSDVEAAYIKRLNIIVLCWQHIQSSTNYQVEITFPDASNRKSNVSHPSIALNNVSVKPSTYSFKVRQYRGRSFSKPSEELIVRTGDSYLAPSRSPGMNISVNVNNTHFHMDRCTQTVD